ncbi:MAG: MerR family transcriptional regulator [Rhodobacter sp.]|nr:MerR family transcriptional regulator [Rhodobacter sp.]
MDKSPDAFRTISEVADWLGTPTHVLRFWESRFSQVKPVKRAGGRRYYRPADMALLGGIKKLLHEDGLTIRGVQKILREEGVKHVSSLSPAIEGLDVAGFAADVAPDPEPDNVVQLQSGPATAPEPEAAAPASDDAGLRDTVQTDAPDTAPDTAAEPPEAEPEPASPTTAFDPEPPAPETESPEGSHIPAFLRPDLRAMPPVPDSDNLPPVQETAAETQTSQDAKSDEPVEPTLPDHAVGEDAAQTAPPDPVAHTSQPDMTPSTADTVRALLESGATVDADALRPLYDRLHDLRQRMSGR